MVLALVLLGERGARWRVWRRRGRWRLDDGDSDGDSDGDGYGDRHDVEHERGDRDGERERERWERC